MLLLAIIVTIIDSSYTVQANECMFHVHLANSYACYADTKESRSRIRLVVACRLSLQLLFLQNFCRIQMLATSIRDLWRTDPC